MVSYDTIILMKPPYTITREIIQLIASVSEKIGAVNASHLYKPATELRKKNRIRTIQSSLEIEGNTLTENQITALLENKRVIAPKKDILEVQNAIRLYDQIHQFNPYKRKDLERAHAVLMKGLVEQAGSFRTSNVGIVKGAKVAHIAPEGAMVNGLMNDLFEYLKKDDDLLLIKSCVFHYEFEFIHPFTDGNGRMGRFWQTVILTKQFPVFEFLPVEHLIKQRQKEYYHALSVSDKKGNSTVFIEFMLGIISDALEELLQSQNKTLTPEDRIMLFKEKYDEKTFTRKEYLQHFKNISAPTASRDLKWAVDKGLLKKSGEQRMTVYWFG